MKEASTLKTEGERLRQLASYNILDTLPEKDYDDLTMIASEICGTEISLISLVDSERQWFKSSHGYHDAAETPREHSFCSHAINQPDDLLIVSDAREDKRFKNNPMVTKDPHFVFYAGAPLVNKEGYALGSLCVMDKKPRQLTQQQAKSLKALSNQVMNLIELRRSRLTLEGTLRQMEKRTTELEEFAYVAAHDMKSPLQNIHSLAEILIMGHADELDKEAEKIVKMIMKSSRRLGDMIQSLLEYRRSDKVLEEPPSLVDPRELLQEIKEILVIPDQVELVLKTNLRELRLNHTALTQILVNLITNAIKYNDTDDIKIELGMDEDQKGYHFYVKDNGPGIPEDKQSKIFELFTVAANKDRDGIRGSGIGLAIVKKLVEAQGGKIWLQSTEGHGTTFFFTLSRRDYSHIEMLEEHVL
ncbi:ATP-binding protein [Roseivirga sp. BDSF3-8]|uniref:sensor histidine kinase n=1 Tax=Roseivirga sp. BDSF3-8 TaxID=3241598 RepID=UPI0035321481